MDEDYEDREEEYDVDPEDLRRDRVDPTISPQAHARELCDRLEEICEALVQVRHGNDTSSFPKRTAEGLIRDSQSLLEGVENQGVFEGSSRIVNSLLRALELLERAGNQYNDVADDLVTAIALASQHGLTIDSYNLRAESKHVDRLKGGKSQ